MLKLQQTYQYMFSNMSKFRRRKKQKIEQIVRMRFSEQNESIPMHEITESLVCTENWVS